jgi:chaperonin GroES
MKLYPKHNHVVLKQQAKEEQKHGNIIVPDIEKQLPLIGEVIAIGKGTYNLNGDLVPVQAKVGEKVAFPAFAGVKFKVGSEEYVVVKDNEIITAIEE